MPVGPSGAATTVQHDPGSISHVDTTTPRDVTVIRFVTFTDDDHNGTRRRIAVGVAFLWIGPRRPWLAADQMAEIIVPTKRNPR